MAPNIAVSRRLGVFFASPLFLLRRFLHWKPVREAAGNRKCGVSQGAVNNVSVHDTSQQMATAAQLLNIRF